MPKFKPCKKTIELPDEEKETFERSKKETTEEEQNKELLNEED